LLVDADTHFVHRRRIPTDLLYWVGNVQTGNKKLALRSVALAFWQPASDAALPV
jgi:hypothetical protein